MRTTKNKNRVGRGRWPLPRVSLLAGGTLLALGACETGDLLEVSDPTVAAPGTVATEAAVPTTLAAAISNFGHAFSGSPGGGSFIDGQITISGMLGDEYYVPDSFPTRIDVDQRETNVQNSTMLAAYARLHTGRRLAEESAALHAQFPATANTAGHAHAMNIAGYSYIMFGENYCSGVPFSNVTPAGELEFGPPLSTQQMFQRAVEFFDQAIAAANAAPTTPAAAATARTQQLNLARVGKGRALLNLNQPAEAAAAVAEVPNTFVYQVFHSAGSTRQQNGAWAATNSTRRLSPSDREGGNGLPYRSANDPRVRWEVPTAAGRRVGFDQSTPFFDQLKYPDLASNTILASGVEARLIEAENQARTGGGWLATLNALRANPPAYYPVTPTATQGGFPNIGTLAPLTGTEAATPIDLVFQERAFWMWQTSHRLGDQRRLMRQYGRDQAGAGFPTGAYFKGGNYGNHVSMLVPFDELNNAQYREQFPNGCDPSQP